MNKAINYYILHEISKLRSAEQRFNAALAAAPADSPGAPFVPALARLQARIDDLDWVLDQMDTIAEPAAA